LRDYIGVLEKPSGKIAFIDAELIEAILPEEEGSYIKLESGLVVISSESPRDVRDKLQ